MINQELISILNEYNIRVDEAIPYLLSLYYGYNPSYIPDDLKRKIHITKIVSIDIKTNTLVWNIPIFNNQETEFSWVKTEYIELFRPLGKATNYRESLTRIKALFTKHPHIRKEDVINATRLYISNTDNKYVRLPHYFIEKGIGLSKTNDILNWIDKLNSYTQDTSSTNFNKLL